MIDTLRNIFTLCLHCFNPSNLVYSMEQSYRLCKMQFAPLLPALQMNIAVCYDFARKIDTEKSFSTNTCSFLHYKNIYYLLCISIHTVLHFLFVFALKDAVNQDFEFELEFQNEWRLHRRL